jgi:hypothetical protein
MEITTYVRNQIPTKIVSSMTQKEVSCDNKHFINHLCMFSCVAFAHLQNETRTKLDSKGIKWIFISYNEETKLYKLCNLISQYVIIICDVIFDEYINFHT